MKTAPLSREQVRGIDRAAIDKYGMSGLVLMENAGRGAAEQISKWVKSDTPVTLLCGQGNNAGDGYVIARHLELMGHSVSIASIVDLSKLTGDAQTNAEIARKADIDIQCVYSSAALDESIRSAEVLVDCLLGTGAKGALRGLYVDAVRAANAATAVRIAIDIPTGLDVDTGEPGDPTFEAELTLTFVGEKLGFQNELAKQFLGRVEVISIGVPQKLLQPFC